MHINRERSILIKKEARKKTRYSKEKIIYKALVIILLIFPAFLFFTINPNNDATTRTEIYQKINVSSTIYDDFSPSLALDSSGNPHVAWQRYDGTDYEIYYAFRNNSDWETFSITMDLSWSYADYSPSLALDFKDIPYVSWCRLIDTEMDGVFNYSDILYAYNSTMGWQNFSITGDNYDDSSPSLALNSSGYPHVAWQRYDGTDYEIYYFHKWESGWQVQAISNDITAINDSSPSLALDSSGNPHVAWQRYDGNGYNIRYAFKSIEGWDEINVTSDSSQIYFDQFPSLVMDSLGDLHVAWQRYNGTDYEIYYTYGEKTTIGKDEFPLCLVVILTAVLFSMLIITAIKKDKLSK